ncbi:MAG: hypothetical protein NT145_05915, partial [Elusimicrobia bacterium]|nr:hypothetical protein [Elusimicrobiota bacterium]
MNRKIISTLLIGIILIESGAGNIYGIFSPSDAGTSTAQFLKLGAGAKESGMGSAQVAASSDANAV